MRNRITKAIVGGIAFFLVMAFLIAKIMFAPVSTNVAVDYNPRVKTVPLYLKIATFITRHWRYKQLVAEILENQDSPEEQVMALYEWTVKNIRPQPSELPVVDDHVWHIIVRGYGAADQVNEVLNLLTTYAGFKSTWFYLSREVGKKRLYLTAVQVNGRWLLFDPYYGNTFRHGDGRLASWQELTTNPTIASWAPNQPKVYGLSYHIYFEGLVGLEPSMGWSRALLQQPWPRFKYELRQRLVMVQAQQKSRAFIARKRSLSKPQ
jgi:hypothetical protein